MSKSITIKGSYVPYAKKQAVTFYTSSKHIYFNKDLDIDLDQYISALKQNLLATAVKAPAGNYRSGFTVTYTTISRENSDNNPEAYLATLPESEWSTLSPATDPDKPCLWKKVQEQIYNPETGVTTLSSPQYQYCGSLGETGIDGASCEWIFKLTRDSNQAAIKQLLNQELDEDYLKNPDYQQSDHIPASPKYNSIWRDNQPTLTNNYPLLWVATRRRKNGYWAHWSEPSIFNRKAVDGIQTGIIYTKCNGEFNQKQWENDWKILTVILSFNAASGKVIIDKSKISDEDSLNYDWYNDTANFNDAEDTIYQAVAYFKDQVCYKLEAPIKITGPDGIGSDGAGMEFIYCSYYTQVDNLTTTYPLPMQAATYTNINIDKGWVDKISEAPFSAAQGYMYVSYRNGNYVDENNWYWVVNNKRYGRGDQATYSIDDPDNLAALQAGNYGWSTPALFSRWGANGKDSNEVEFIYLQISKDNYDYLTTTLEGNWPKFTDLDADFPYTIFGSEKVQWTDDPKGVTIDKPYEYVCIRKSTLNSEGKREFPDWDTSKISIWNNYTESTHISFNIYPNLIMIKDKIPVDNNVVTVEIKENEGLKVCNAISLNGDKFENDETNYQVDSNYTVTLKKNTKNQNWTITVTSVEDPSKPLNIQGYIGDVLVGEAVCTFMEQAKDGIADSYSGIGAYICTLNGGEVSFDEKTEGIFTAQTAGSASFMFKPIFNKADFSLKIELLELGKTKYTFTASDPKESVSIQWSGIDNISALTNIKEFQTTSINYLLYNQIRVKMENSVKTVYEKVFDLTGDEGYCVNKDKDASVSIYKSDTFTSAFTQLANYFNKKVTNDSTEGYTQIMQTAKDIIASAQQYEETHTYETTWTLEARKALLQGFVDGLDTVGIRIQPSSNSDEESVTYENEYSLTLKAGITKFINEADQDIMTLDENGNLKLQGTTTVKGALQAKTIGYKLCKVRDNWHKDLFNEDGSHKTDNSSELADYAGQNLWITAELIPNEGLTPAGLFLSGKASVYIFPVNYIDKEYFNSETVIKDKITSKTSLNSFYALPNPSDVPGLSLELIFLSKLAPINPYYNSTGNSQDLGKIYIAIQGRKAYWGTDAQNAGVKDFNGIYVFPTVEDRASGSKVATSLLTDSQGTGSSSDITLPNGYFHIYTYNSFIIKTRASTGGRGEFLVFNIANLLEKDSNKISCLKGVYLKFMSTGTAWNLIDWHTFK